jgi:hypothetical protein
MRFRWLAFAAMGLAGPAVAQSPPPAEESAEIIVQGHKYRDKDVRDFIDALTETRFDGQLSKFDWAVCPAAVGLSDRHRIAIAARMRQVAAAAGMKLGDAAKCRPNALVIVASDTAELIKALRKKYPVYFKDGLGDRIKPRKHGPVTVWHVEGRLDSNGMPAARNLESRYYVTESTDSSRLIPASRPHFAAGVMVVDLQALEGLTTTQLADYAAMRLFARTDPSRLKNGSAPTILHAIEAPMGSLVPITLTQWDLGFLKALYGTSDNQFANRQRGAMKQMLRKELQQSSKTDQ